MLNQFWPRFTCLWVSYIWGSGYWETDAEFGSAMSHVFFSKDMIDEPAYTGVNMRVSVLQEVDRFGCWRAMMWAAISCNHRTNLVRVQGNLTAQRYRDNILQPHMLNVIDRQREILQQDNDRPHTARVAMDCLTQNNINVLPWPSKSPD